VAAQVLADDLSIQAENTAKWWHNQLVNGTSFDAGQLVIIDEASLAGTLSFDRITHLPERAGAKVLLVGDFRPTPVRRRRRRVQSLGSRPGRCAGAGLRTDR
jgi:hypothetical protein